MNKYENVDYITLLRGRGCINVVGKDFTGRRKDIIFYEGATYDSSHPHFNDLLNHPNRDVLLGTVNEFRNNPSIKAVMFYKQTEVEAPEAVVDSKEVVEEAPQESKRSRGKKASE